MQLHSSPSHSPFQSNFSDLFFMLLLIRVDVRLKADEFPDLCTDPLATCSGSLTAFCRPPLHRSNPFFLKMQLYLLHVQRNYCIPFSQTYYQLKELCSPFQIPDRYTCSFFGPTMAPVQLNGEELVDCLTRWIRGGQKLLFCFTLSNSCIAFLCHIHHPDIHLHFA